MIWRSESVILPPLFYLVASEKEKLKPFSKCCCRCFGFTQKTNNSVYPLLVWFDQKSSSRQYLSKPYVYIVYTIHTLFQDLGLAISKLPACQNETSKDFSFRCSWLPGGKMCATRCVRLSPFLPADLYSFLSQASTWLSHPDSICKQMSIQKNRML